ncbi:MAG: hypothetical protein ACYTG4_12995 [Planctomycetota bacterium]
MALIFLQGRFWQWEMENPKTTVTELTTTLDKAKGLILEVKAGKTRDESWRGLVGEHSFEELFSNEAFRPEKLP